MMFYMPMTGVIGPQSAQAETSQAITPEEIPLASGWLVGLIGLALIALIMQKKAKSMMIDESRISQYAEFLKPYLKEALSRGYPKEILREKLREKNWPTYIIDKCFKRIEKGGEIYANIPVFPDIGK